MSDRDKKLLLGAAAVIILILAYRFGFTNFNDKAAELETSVNALKAEYNTLHEYYKKKDFYIAGKENNEKIANEILGKFAANNTQEYQLMFLRSFETENNWISSYALPANTTKTSLVATSAKELVGNVAEVSINFKADYDNLMLFLERLNYCDKKTSINNFSVAYNKQEQTYSGSMSLMLYSITGTDRIAETVSSLGVLIRDDESIFQSSTFEPNMSKDDQTIATQIRNDNDVYVLVNPLGSTLDAVIVGLSNDTVGKNNIVASDNKKHDVTITISGSNGEYKAAYKVDSALKEATEFVAGETIDILIASSNRPDDVDLNSANINIINDSDREVNYTVINDDPDNGRIIVNVKGKVNGY